MSTFDATKFSDTGGSDTLTTSQEHWEGLLRQRGPYEIALRTIGIFLDVHRAYHANVMEGTDGFTVRYQRSDRDPGMVAEHLPYANLIEIARELRRKHRLRALSFGIKGGGAGRRYEQTLRALGPELDQAQAYSFLLDEVDEGFLVTYQYLKPSQGFMVRKRMIFLDLDSIERALDSVGRRRSGVESLLNG